MERKVNLRQNNYKIGQFIQLSRRISDKINSRGEAGHEVRTFIGDRIVEISPDFANENFDDGTVTGALVSAVAAVVDEYVPIAAEAEIVDVELIEGGTRYTVNVDSPLESQARFRAMIESGSGYTSYIVDEFDMNDPEPLHKRPARDTWQVEVTVREPDAAAQTIIEKGIEKLRGRRKPIERVRR